MRNLYSIHCAAVNHQVKPIAVVLGISKPKLHRGSLIDTNPPQRQKWLAWAIYGDFSDISQFYRKAFAGRAVSADRACGNFRSRPPIGGDGRHGVGEYPVPCGLNRWYRLDN